MARAWSAWLPDLVPHVPGCAIPIVQHELRRAAQAFFQASRAWRLTLAPVPVAGGTETVTIVPADAEVALVRVEQCWYDGQRLDIKTADELATEHGEDWSLHTGAPSAFLQETPGVVRLYPIPISNAVTGLKTRVAVMPSEVSTGIPDDLANTYHQDLATGAKARLMLYPNKPWTAFDLGVAYGNAFGAAINSARISAACGFGDGRIKSTAGWC